MGNNKNNVSFRMTGQVHYCQGEEQRYSERFELIQGSIEGEKDFGVNNAQIYMHIKIFRSERVT